MVGLVIVSHSAAVAKGVVALARQMGGADVAIEPAGGIAGDEDEIGTDFELIQSALERASGPDGVLVLMDLGSAVSTAEMAVEMLAGGDARIVLSPAPLVEGAVAAAARAGSGASLDEVAQEARSALRMKAADLGGEEADGGTEAEDAAAAPATDGGATLRVDVAIPLGIHARPAARIVEAAAGFDAAISVSDETNGRGPADARSLSGLVMLGARQGHSLLVRASGADADDALAALRQLADENFGDEVDGKARAATGAPAPRRAAPSPSLAPDEPADAVAPPAPGTRLQGVAVAPGIAIAPARRPSAPAPAVVADEPAGDPAAERARLDAALAATRDDVRAARARIAQTAGQGEAAIFDAHLLLLDDALLLDAARGGIDEGRSAPAAWDAAVGSAAASYRELDDAYLRERAADVEDVGRQVLAHLAGADGGAGGAATPAEPGILVFADLAPSEAAGLDPSVVRGVALARGGATSHAAILARALGIPAVVGLGAPLLAVAEGTPLVLDGAAGAVEVDPPPEELAARERAAQAAAERQARAREHAREPARTTDGTVVEVAANVGKVADAQGAVELGADGVGLLRTEFLFLDRDDAPDEDEQRSVLAEIAQALEGRPLIVRTLDAGADKPLRYLEQAPEDNPFLGVRGIRLGLERPAILRTQLRAIMRVALEHPIRVMFPMVATLAEYRAARGMLDEVREDVGAGPVEVGIMVEVPAAAVGAERFARDVDFFSIGTNDLTQYTMAAERGNDALAALLSGPLPPVLRLVAAVTQGASAHGRWVGVCGELAGDPVAAVVLAGLGVQELSMAAPLIPAVKETLRGVALAQAREVAMQALEAEDAAAVAALVRPLLADG